MDFINGLPLSFGKEVIMVVVDRLSKYGHFIALAHPYSAATVAKAYMENIYKLHGMPKSIVSDRDAMFLSTFWQELFTIHGVDLLLSSSYHPETDGQTEVLNRCLETYLRCFCSAKPKEWSSWLSIAEWWYNTTYHSATKMTPYEAVYGQPPPFHLPYLPGESKVAAVDSSLQQREEVIKLLRFNLQRAQHRMVQMANKKRSDRQFQIGDLVLLKLQPYRQQSLVQRPSHKLCPRYFGPYKILDKVGAVAYKLDLPAEAKIHHTFHVSQLKAYNGGDPTFTAIPSHLFDEVVPLEPEAILDRRTIKRRNQAATQVLIKWKDHPVEDATWEFWFDIQNKFPQFNP